VVTSNSSHSNQDTPWVWQLEEFFPSQTGAGKPVLERVLQQLREMKFGDLDVYSVHMALEEALVNAIRHGNGNDSSKKVHVLCHASEDKIVIQVEDEGPGFDPGDVPDPTLEENIDKDHGRGIMLMRNFMNHVEYNDKGNKVVMEKVRTPS